MTSYVPIQRVSRQTTLRIPHRPVLESTTTKNTAPTTTKKMDAASVLKLDIAMFAGYALQSECTAWRFVRMRLHL